MTTHYVKVSCRQDKNSKYILLHIDHDAATLLGNANGAFRFAVSMLDYKTFEIQTSEIPKTPKVSTTYEIRVPTHLVDYEDGETFKMKQFPLTYNPDDNTVTFECDINSLPKLAPVLPTLKVISSAQDKANAGFDPESAWGVSLDAKVSRDVMRVYMQNIQQKVDLYA